MHKLLQSQLKRYRGSSEAPPAEWQSFLEAVDAAYQQAEQDRCLLEQTLAFTAQELTERNQRLQHDLAELQLAEEALRESEEIWRRLYGDLPGDSVTIKINLTERKGTEDVLRIREGFLRRQAQTLETLARSERLYRGDLSDSLPEITEAAARTLGVERASVWFYNKARSTIQCVDLYTLSANRHAAGIELQALQYPAYFAALEEDRTMAIADAYLDPRTTEFSASYLTPFHITSLLDAPIRMKGRLVGIVCHEHVGAVRQWTLEEQNFAGSLADFVSLALEACERRQAEDALRKSEAKYRELVQNASSCILRLDTQGRITFFNEFAQSFFGYPEQEILGQTMIGTIVPALDSTGQDLTAMFANLLRQPEQYAYNEHENIRRNSERVWMTWTNKAILDERGQLVEILCVGNDITKRKQIERDLQFSMKEQEQHTRDLRLLSHMSSLLQACRTEEETYSVVRNVCKLLFPADSGYLSILERTRMRLQVVTSWGELPSDPQAFGADDCWALRLDETYVVEPADLKRVCQHLKTFPNDGYLCAPISASGDLLGMFHLRFSPFKADYSENEGIRMREAKRLLVNRVVTQYALSLVNLRLRDRLQKEAIRDPLTGLYNRRHMEASLEREAARAERLNAPVGLIMLDVDHFKHFNDSYGHEVGDDVLRELGNLLRTSVRSEDIACRYGGEEFLLILPEASLQNVSERAEAIRRKVKELRIAHRGAELTITISVGVALLPDHGPGIEHALKAADIALYQAKVRGRDQVVVAPSARDAK